MLPSVTITLSPETLALLARVSAWPRALTRAVIATLSDQNQITVGHIQRTRASGKGPYPVSEGKLGHVSGFYVKELWAAKPVVSGGSILSAIGNHIRYAGGHEFGFNGTVPVKEHTRRRFETFTQKAGAYLDPRTGRIRKSKKRTVTLTAAIFKVKAHQMRMHIPERAPIRRGIEDRLPLYGPALGNSIVAALNAGGTS